MFELLQESVVSTTPWAELLTSPKLSHEDNFEEGEGYYFDVFMSGVLTGLCL